MSQLSRIPGPKGAPLVGQLFEMWRDAPGTFLEGQRAHGDLVRFRFGPYPFVLASDPEDVRRVLVQHHDRYRKSRNYESLKLAIGNGLVTSEGAFWKRQRRLAQPAFHPKRIDEFARTMVLAAVEAADRWQGEGKEELDLHAEMMRLTFRIVGLTLLSEDLDTEAKDFAESLEEVLRYANARAELGILSPPWFPSPANLRFWKHKRFLDRVVLERIEARRKSALRPADLLTHLLEAEDPESGERMDPAQLLDEMLTLVIAGHETTANALTFTFHLLAHHPEVRARLEAELDEELGGRVPTQSDLGRLRYTEQVIKEAMRLYPPAWIIEREAVAEDELAGVAIPAGTVIAISPYVIHRHPRFYPEPERFDPDRFAPDAIAERPRYAYLPFGAGPRVCIGSGFALTEAKAIVATLAQRHRFEPILHSEPALFAGVTLRPSEGLPMRLRRHPSRSSAGPRAAAASR